MGVAVDDTASEEPVLGARVALGLDELVIGYGVDAVGIAIDGVLVVFEFNAVDGAPVTETELGDVTLLAFEAGAYVVDPEADSAGPDVEGIGMEEPAGVVAPVVLRAWLEKMDN